MELLGNIKSSLVNTFSTTSPPPASISKSEVRGLEETERSRRLEQVSQARVDKQNASNVSTLIKGQSFPVFKGNVSRGYKRVTTKFEDEERRRRITNKSESALRRTNANKTARMIQSLGWPLYKQGHSGAEYILMDPTKLLEEEEREWRTTDSYWTPTARHNAATVANILRWNNFQRNPRAGFKRHVKYLEEKERKDRIQADVMNNAMQNSYNEARLIRQKGAPFYVQEAPLAKRDFSQVHQLEESERKRRMQNPGERQLAKELAGLVGGHLNKQTDLEEKERGRRITDIGQQNLAKANAKQVSLMVRESSTTKIAGQGPMWLGISRNSMRALEEIERTRRMRDVDGQRVAREHAKAVSNLMLGRMIAPPKPNSAVLEEEERQSRILDRQRQQTAVKNARKVSGLIARHMLMSSGSKSYALALEESERSRRLQDNEQQRLARDNAKRVSNLVSSLQVAPGNALTRSQTVPSIPTQQAQLSTPTTLTDVARSSGEFHKTQSPLVAAAPISRAAPIAAAPVAAAPVAVAPIAAAPVAAPPIAAPMARSASSSQIGSQANPIVLPTVYSNAPVAPQQLASSPTIQPIVLPTTSAPVPVAPLASAIPRQPSFTTVPVDSAATSVAQLGDKERKRLMKEVDKHNKKSESQVRKAEHQMLKAEKFHQKGRDDKALKLESKAERLMQEAEHERKWATGIQNELRNTPAPASM